MLGKQLGSRVQNYVKALTSSSVVIAAAQGLVRATDRTLLVAHGGHIALTKTWAVSLLGRINTKQ